jgi:molecular chaperone HtpG
MVSFESLGENESPMIITQNEFMRRMKDMSAMNGMNSFYGAMPDSYNLVVNSDHELVKKLVAEKDKKLSDKIEAVNVEVKPVNEEIEKLEAAVKDKKDEEVPQAEKDKIEELRKKRTEIEGKKKEMLKDFGKKNKLVKQLIDLALLSNNMLKGEALTNFVKRSVDMIK